MRILTVTIQSVLIPAFLWLGAEAQPLQRVKVRKVIHRTAVVIYAAQRAVREHRVYTGHLARAVAHQRLAKRLYLRGMYLRAIHHSRRARLLAFRALEANRVPVAGEWRFDAEEEGLFRNPPGEQELENELKKEMPGAATKDEEVLQQELKDIDAGENE